MLMLYFLVTNLLNKDYNLSVILTIHRKCLESTVVFSAMIFGVSKTGT